MSRELFMDAHEQLVEEYLEKHLDAERNEAYEKTACMVFDRIKDTLADRADYLRMKAKEGIT